MVFSRLQWQSWELDPRLPEPRPLPAVGHPAGLDFQKVQGAGGREARAGE